MEIGKQSDRGAAFKRGDRGAAVSASTAAPRGLGGRSRKGSGLS